MYAAYHLRLFHFTTICYFSEIVCALKRNIRNAKQIQTQDLQVLNYGQRKNEQKNGKLFAVSNQKKKKK